MLTLLECRLEGKSVQATGRIRPVAVSGDVPVGDGVRARFLESSLTEQAHTYAGISWLRGLAAGKFLADFRYSEKG